MRARANFFVLFGSVCSLFVFSFCQTDAILGGADQEEQKADPWLELKATIAGNWYQKSYIDQLGKNRSPYRSRFALDERMELLIDTGKIIGDSLFIATQGMDQSSSFTLFLADGFTSTTFPTDITDTADPGGTFELGHIITSSDTLLILNKYKGGKIVGQVTYDKLNSNEVLQHRINTTLLAGSYRMNDTLLATFAPTGEISGLADFLYYTILTDFTSQQGTGIDQVCFERQSKERTCLAFDLANDTLRLYNISLSGANQAKGRLLYTLLRQ